jgi:putative ABC transport system permease protein
MCPGRLSRGIGTCVAVSSCRSPNALQSSSRGITSPGRVTGWRFALVVAQIAIAMILRVGASLLICSVLQLAAVNPGFESQHTMTLDLSITWPEYKDDINRGNLLSTLIQPVSELPGVESAPIIYGVARGESGLF